nr:ABC transporter ATP-binding protein [Piscinibacter sakaiensis]
MRFTRDGQTHPVLAGIDLQVERGEFIALIGHSGCGKSTVLNIVAGLLQPSSGGVILDGREVAAPGPDRAVVFQNHSLLPWLTVYQNVEIAVDKVFRDTRSKAERRDWVLHSLEMVNMGHALQRLPSEISGGMKQRVGIARALAMEPKVLLLDEPFGALDALTRAHLQDEVMRIQAELHNTVLMITHDVDEAVLLSDRIVMMTNGPAATIGQVLAVDLPRPRDRIALADDATYNHCRHEVLSFLYEKQRKVEPLRARPAPAPARQKTAA